MNFQQVQDQLYDLPTTFRKETEPYTQLVDAITAMMYRLTLASDGTVSQTVFANATGGWLDVWGLLFGVPRRSNEPDVHYSARILYVLNTGAGSPNAIVFWIRAVWGIKVVLTENFPATGYTITFPAVVTPELLAQILASLVYVRPAGVPFTAIDIANVGPYLQTVNFLGAPRITGAYLTGTVNNGDIGLGATTNNALPLLPDLYLTDPVLNPSLSVGA